MLGTSFARFLCRGHQQDILMKFDRFSFENTPFRGLLPLFLLVLLFPGSRLLMNGSAVAQDLFSANAKGTPESLIPFSPRLPRQNLLLFRGDDGKIAEVTDKAGWLKRRQEIVESMQYVMGELPGDARKCPLDVKVEEELHFEKYVRRLITYQSELGSRVPAYLCIPKSALDEPRKKARGVLCLHPTDNKIGHRVVVDTNTRPNRQYASELAEEGFVTIAPSYPLLANYQPDLKGLGWKSGSLKAVWDNQRALDVLASLPMVQANEFGCIGHSLGGHNSVYTAVFDDRLKVVVSSCGLDSYLDYYDGVESVWQPEKGWCQTRYIPMFSRYRGRLKDIPFDFHEMIAALAPRHVLIVAPKSDSNFRARSVDQVARAAREVFELTGHRENLMVEHPDCGHDFPPEVRRKAYDLIRRVLE